MKNKINLKFKSILSDKAFHINIKNDQEIIINYKNQVNYEYIKDKIFEERNRKIICKSYNSNIDIKNLDIAIIVPSPIRGSGGHRSIFRCVKLLKNKNHRLTVYYYQTNENTEEIRNKVSEWFYPMDGVDFIKYDGKLGFHDVGICTWWETAYFLRENINKIKYGFYYIQDFEPGFFPLNSSYILSEATYTMGFTPICSGEWCSKFLLDRYSISSRYYDFPLNTNIYNIREKNKKDKKKLIFFAKPEMPRRLFELGAAALKVLSQTCDDLEIILFGSDELYKRKIDFDCIIRGLLPTINDLADLYNEADLGLVFSPTNPSLVPYEMMACGCPVADINFDNALSKYGNSNNNVFLLSIDPLKMAQELKNILQDTKELKNKIKNGYEFVMKKLISEEQMGNIIEDIIIERIKK